jgi:hypothetical protein
LVRRHQARALAVARHIIGSREEAEGVVQESFAKALDRLDSFNSAAHSLLVPAHCRPRIESAERMRRRLAEPMPDQPGPRVPELP